MAKKIEIQVISKKEVEERLTNEAFLARAIFEMVGKPKKHIESALKDYVQRFSKEEGFGLVSYEVHDAEKYEGSKDLYSTFAEVEFVAKDHLALLNFCVDYMPASVEVLEPERLHVDANYLSNLLTELVGRMHLIDGEFKKVVAKTNVLTQSLNIMAQNSILILLNMGPRTAEKISEVVGIKTDQLDVYLNKLVEDKKISKTGDTYTLVKQ
jgi:hypothetical protein